MSKNPTTEAEVLTYMARLAVIEPDLVSDDEAHELAGRICRTLRQAFALTWGRDARRAFDAITTEQVWEYEPSDLCQCSAFAPSWDDTNAEAIIHELMCHGPDRGWMIDQVASGPEALAWFLNYAGEYLPPEVLEVLTELLAAYRSLISARLELHAHQMHTLEAEPEVLNAEHAHEHAHRRPERCHHRPHLVAVSTNDDPASAGHFGAKNCRYSSREADRRR